VDTLADALAEAGAFFA